VAGATAYLRAEFHLDLSNRLASIHQRHRQDRQKGQRSDSIGQTVGGLVFAQFRTQGAYRIPDEKFP